MSRILKRPMFRKGGSTGQGIMSGLVDRTKHADNPIVTGITGLDKDRLDINTKAIMDLLSEYAPVPKTKFDVGTLGLGLASGKTLTEALKEPYQRFVKSDDIRRGQLAKRGEGALTTALKLEMERNKKKGVRTLTEPEVKALNLPKGSIVQQDSAGKINVVSKPSDKVIEKRQDFASTIGLLNKIEEKYFELGKPVGAPFDPQRFKGQIGRVFGTQAGKDYATLVSDIKKTTVFLTKAISGAQVSDKEREFIMQLIPQLNDTEATFESKLKSLRAYLGDAAKKYGGDVEALMKAGISAKNYLPSNLKSLEDLTDEELRELRDKMMQNQTNKEQQP